MSPMPASFAASYLRFLSGGCYLQGDDTTNRKDDTLEYTSQVP